MSLINKMLSDLEERHSYIQEHNQALLGDLAPINDTGFSSSKKIPYNFLLLCFFLTAVSVAVYGYLGGSFSGSGNQNDSRATDKTSGSVADSQDNRTVQQSVAVTPLPGATDANSLSGLKLDLSLPLQPRVSPAPVVRPAGIKTITVNIADDVTRLELLLDRSTGYRAYPLENPDRAVLEIDNALLQAEIPVISEHPYIERFHYSNSSGESFKLVADASMPISIENSRMLEDSQGGYRLTILLQADAGRTPATAPPVETASVEASSSGEMNVRPSAAKGKTVERLFGEARQLYARRDFSNADETVQAILKQQPLHVQARTLYATTLINRGNTEAAIQTLNSGLKLNPGISEWADLYARLLVNIGQNELAVEVLSQALPDISHHDYYAFYAALLQRLSRHEEASEFYRTLLKQNPENGLWWMGLGISLDALAYRDDALQAFQSALQGQNLDYDLRQYILQQIERLSG